MNWIKENKFLAGFLGAMVAGLAVFGFLLYSSWSHYSEVTDNYRRQSAELSRLQKLAPFPNEENLKKLRQQKDAYVLAIVGLQKNLSSMEYPLEPLEPAAYQDILRKTVSAVVEKANKNGVKLPDKFYGGLEVYQTAPPKDAAAATALGRELKAIELVVNTLLDCKIDAITSITRTPLPEEGGAKTTGPAAAGGKAGPGPLVKKHSFTIGFTADQSSLRRALNEISSAREQFLIVRMLRIKNENEKGPSRGGDASGGLPGSLPVASGTGSEPNALKFVVGTEKLNALAVIDIVDFEPPSKK